MTHQPQYPQYSPKQAPTPSQSRTGGLGPGPKAALFVGIPVTMLLLCCGGLAAIGSFAGDPQPTEISIAGQQERRSEATSGETPADAVTATTTEPSATAATTGPTASVQTKTVTETEKIGFKTKRVNDPNLAKGKTSVRTRGVAGVRTLTYEVTLTDGVETDRRLVSNKVTKQPVTQVIAVGTKATKKCDPNYSGCVPIASDVDCAGGSGNGPAYVTGPVRVIGSDIYGLDHDGDGVGCEN
nr:G5 domain-containing protein [Micromonospora sp. DSM 115978]